MHQLHPGANGYLSNVMIILMSPIIKLALLQGIENSIVGILCPVCRKPIPKCAIMKLSTMIY